MTLTLWEEPQAEVIRLEPVMIEHVRVCHFKRKPDEDGHKKIGCARCGQARRHPDHLGAPPSLNVFGSGDSKVYWQVKMQWQELLSSLLIVAGLPRGLSSVMVEGEATFPDRVARDQGNFRVVIEKALGDALVAGGWLHDDDWDRYTFGNLAKSYERGVSATRLVLFPVAGPPPER